MANNPVQGAHYLIEGAKLLSQPGIRAFVIMPLMLNIVIFSLLFYFSFQFIEGWIAYLTTHLPEWLEFVAWLFWVVFALLFLLVSGYSFNIVAALIAAPFNGLLAEKVELHLSGETFNADTNIKAMLALVPYTLKRETKKLGYYLPRVLGLIVITAIPVLQIASPVLWFLFGAWMLALQYIDYPMDNHQTDFDTMKEKIRSKPMLTIGFGAATVTAFAIPIVNFLVMPAAVAGATLFWVREFKEMDASSMGK